MGEGAAQLARPGGPALHQGIESHPAIKSTPVNPDVAELGRYLFFDTRLSGDTSLSCASCHDPAKGWADGAPLSKPLRVITLLRHYATSGMPNYMNALKTRADVGLYAISKDENDMGKFLSARNSTSFTESSDAKTLEESDMHLRQQPTAWMVTCSPPDACEPCGQSCAIQLPNGNEFLADRMPAPLPPSSIVYYME